MIDLDADDDKTVIIGGATGDAEGSQPFSCSECSKTIWLSPTLIRKQLQVKDAILACMFCVRLPPSAVDDVVIIPEQIEELSRSLGRRVTEKEMRDVLRRHLIERDN